MHLFDPIQKSIIRKHELWNTGKYSAEQTLCCKESITPEQREISALTVSTAFSSESW